MRFLFLLLFVIPAHAELRNVRGYVFNKTSEGVYFSTVDANPENQVIFILHGANDPVEKELKKLEVGLSYEVRLSERSAGEQNLNHAFVLNVMPVKFAFRGTNLEEPNPDNKATMPALDFADPRLADRADVYKHFLNSPVWIRKFRRAGGTDQDLDNLRKTVLANTVLSEFPSYPYKQHEQEFKQLLDIANKLWIIGGGTYSLRLLQGTIEDALEPHLFYDPAPEAELNRKGVETSCNLLLQQYKFLVGTEFNEAMRLRAHLIIALQNMAANIPTTSIDAETKLKIKQLLRQ